MRRALNQGGRKRRWLVAATAATLAGGAAVTFGVLPVGAAEVTLQAPFKCGDVWSVNDNTSGDRNKRSVWPADSADDTVLAMADGKVTSASRGYFGTRAVQVRHSDGSTSTLNGMETITVKDGDTVRQGQQIGRIGETAWHWGWTTYGGTEKPWIVVAVHDADGESQPVTFDGRAAEPGTKVTSKNCPA